MSLQANVFDVRSILHGQVSLSAVNQTCLSLGYERLQKSKDSLNACFENVKIYNYLTLTFGGLLAILMIPSCPWGPAPCFSNDPLLSMGLMFGHGFCGIVPCAFSRLTMGAGWFACFVPFCPTGLMVELCLFLLVLYFSCDLRL